MNSLSSNKLDMQDSSIAKQIVSSICDKRWNLGSVGGWYWELKEWQVKANLSIYKMEAIFLSAKL